MDDFVNNYKKDIENIKQNKRNLNMFKIINEMEINIKFIEKLYEENKDNENEYKISLLNDNKNALFDRLYKDLSIKNIIVLLIKTIIYIYALSYSTIFLQ